MYVGLTSWSYAAGPGDMNFAGLNLSKVDFMTALTFCFTSFPKIGNVYLSSNKAKSMTGEFFLIVALEPSNP
jgi:hypothetical protein